MTNEQETNIERWDKFFADLHKKHPDTLYSLDPVEREEEMKNEPVLSIEELRIVLDRPLEPDATPAEIELNKQCKIFLEETMVPFEEFLNKLDRGEIEDLDSFLGRDNPDNPDDTEIPSLIENEGDYE